MQGEQDVKRDALCFERPRDESARQRQRLREAKGDGRRAVLGRGEGERDGERRATSGERWMAPTAESRPSPSRRNGGPGSRRRLLVPVSIPLMRARRRCRHRHRHRRPCAVPPAEQSREPCSRLHHLHHLHHHRYQRHHHPLHPAPEFGVSCWIPCLCFRRRPDVVAHPAFSASVGDSSPAVGCWLLAPSHYRIPQPSSLFAVGLSRRRPYRFISPISPSPEHATRPVRSLAGSSKHPVVGSAGVCHCARHRNTKKPAGLAACLGSLSTPSGHLAIITNKKKKSVSKGLSNPPLSYGHDALRRHRMLAKRRAATTHTLSRSAPSRPNHSLPAARPA